MNKARRSRIAAIQDQIESIGLELQDIYNEEENAYYNLPDSLQDTDRGNAMSEAFESIEEAMSLLEDVSSYLDDAKGV